MLEGFINAKVIVEPVRRIGARVSRESFATALESLQRYDWVDMLFRSALAPGRVLAK